MGDHHLAHGDGAGRHVEDQWRMFVGGRKGRAVGIGGVARVDGAERRD